MPAVYAHFSFGKRVICKLRQQETLRTKDILRIIDKNRNIFDIGLQGPDILFFYQPLSKNEVNNLGKCLHDEQASEFFRASVSKIKVCEDKDIYLSYILGFICHFALDSECHSYIEDRTIKTGVEHTEIETAFEQLLLVKDNIDFNKYNTSSYIQCREEEIDAIGYIFKFDKKIIDKAIKSMKFCHKMYLPGGKIKNWIVKSIFKFTGKKDYFEGLLVYKEHSEQCLKSSQELFSLYLDAVEVACDLLCNFYEYYQDKDILSSRFDRTYGPFEEYMKRYM